ncbi:MAG TPA: hypothetical protein VM344_07895 [Vitreimonas sp.]|nr:hypothetical protein [Vitreimonas sp.]
MNDRFAAQLRQHLLDTADERPAEGHLTALLERVAVTGQRHPLAARLTWVPGRIGPFPSAALRYGLVAAALVGAILSAALLVGGAPSGRTVFEGTWTSTDPGDGSNQTLVVGAGRNPTVHFEDDFATGDACRDDALKVFTADGIGTIVDDRLHVEWPAGGGCGLMTVPIGSGFIVYDEDTDTLRGFEDLTWVRSRGDDRPVTQEPEPFSPAAQAAETASPAVQEPETPSPVTQEPETPSPAAEEPEAPSPAAEEPETPSPSPSPQESPAAAAEEPETPSPAAAPQEPQTPSPRDR